MKEIKSIPLQEVDYMPLETNCVVELDLRRENVDLNKFMKSKVGSGSSTLFWWD